jgi:hypothetical protein
MDFFAGEQGSTKCAPLSANGLLGDLKTFDVLQPRRQDYADAFRYPVPSD